MGTMGSMTVHNENWFELRVRVHYGLSKDGNVALHLFFTCRTACHIGGLR